MPKYRAVMDLFHNNYLFLAISDLILAFFLFMLYVLASCGFGVVLFIPGILQIIAGFKFVKAIKMYED